MIFSPKLQQHSGDMPSSEQSNCLGRCMTFPFGFNDTSTPFIAFLTEGDEMLIQGKVITTERGSSSAAPPQRDNDPRGKAVTFPSSRRARLSKFCRKTLRVSSNRLRQMTVSVITGEWDSFLERGKTSKPYLCRNTMSASVV